MTELSGHVQDFGLVALVRFLAESGGSGCLRISQQSWTGEVVFDQGRVAASIGEDRGKAALELIALALSDGNFAYTDGPPGAQLSGDTGGIQLQQALEWLAARPPCGSGNALLCSVPRVADLREEARLTRGGPQSIGACVAAGRRRSPQCRPDLDRLSFTSICLCPGSPERPGSYRDSAAWRPGPSPDAPAPPVESRPPITNASSSAGSSAPDPEAPNRSVDTSATGMRSVVPVAQAPQTTNGLTEAVYTANGLTETGTHADSQLEPPMNAANPPRPGEAGRQRVVRYLLSTILVCALFAIGAQSVIQAVRVEGNSMLPGLQIGQFLLISRAAYFHVEGSPLAGLVPASSQGATRYLFGGPRRGDIVAFRSPAKGNSEFILRIIALPGEYARIEQGTVFVDDRALAEPYTLPAADPNTYPGDGQSIHIPDDSYFVLSDNRAVSQDSRLGWFVRVDDLIGRAWLTYWPPALWGDFAQPLQLQTPPAPISATPSSGADAVPTLAAVKDTTIAPVASTVAPIQPTASPVVPAVGTLLDGAITNQAGWRSDPAGPVSLNGAQYRMTVQLPTRFVAVAAPVVGTYADVIVSATFHKIGGPPGGGYGVIVRDQTPETRDGLDQSGRFYVAEAGDLGEIGVWRREDDHWVDLVPWTHSEVVHVGGTTNELTLRAEGQRLTFLVNGIQQASVRDPALPAGGVGVFIGGDFNQVVLDRFTVQLPPSPTAP